jgi:hypothetical protein
MKKDIHSKILNKLAFLETNKLIIGKTPEELQSIEGQIVALKYVAENKPQKGFVRGLMLGYQKALEIIENKK